MRKKAHIETARKKGNRQTKREGKRERDANLNSMSKRNYANGCGKVECVELIHIQIENEIEFEYVCNSTIAQ